MGKMDRIVSVNRRAKREYELFETYEAGIELKGSEVKSLRQGSVNIKDAYVAIVDHQAYLLNCHIGPYPFADQRHQHDPERRRKLLLHRREIDRLYGKSAERGFTLVPLRVYFLNGRAKLEFAVGRGRKLHDKREQKRRQAIEREIEQVMRRRR